MNDLRELGRLCVDASDIRERWRLIRKAYVLAMPMINAASPRWADPYFIDWIRIFTPIELDAWMSIRSHRVPFYPQFPASGKFIDFANPEMRIGVEVDGAAYHDAEKDRARDAMLANRGWTVYRISGRESIRGGTQKIEADCLTEDEQYDAMKQWMMSTGDGVLAAIRAVHFGEQIDDISLAMESLHAHTLQ